MKKRIVHWLSESFFFALMYATVSLSQTLDQTAYKQQPTDLTIAERPPRVLLTRNSMTWHESDSLWAAKWMSQRPNHGSAVRGVEWIRQDRGAVYNNAGEFVRLEVKWSSSVPIKAMRVNTYTSLEPRLYDDGTHGDKVAGDGIWTLDSLSAYWSSGSPRYQWYKSSQYGCATYIIYPIEWQLSDGTWDNDASAQVRVGLVDPLSTFEVQKLGPGLWATEYALFIEDSLQTQRTFPGYPVTDKTWAENMKPASAIFYNYFPDSFDFLVVTPATPVWLPGQFLGERVPNHFAVRNDVGGIGLQKFDSTRIWGSSGKLRASVYHSNGSFDILSHELGHTWMAYLDSLTFSNGGCGVHWAENQTIGGRMSLWPMLVETAPGVFRGVVQDTADAFDAAFSNLDFYLMGLKPLSDVPLLKRLNNPDYSNPAAVKYSSVTVTDPQTFPTRYGQRTPAYPNSQRNFSMATIVVKPLGWTEAEFAYFSILAKHAADTLDDGFGYNYCFEKAAKGLASLESKMYTPSGTPSVPALVSPANGSTVEPASVTLKWSLSQSTSSYHLQISQKNDFTDTLIERKDLTGTSYAPLGLKKNATYYWRVSALGSTGFSKFSTAQTFSTSGDSVQTPTLASPADSAKNVSANPTLSWNSLSGATSYHLQLSVAPAFSSNIVDDSTLTVTSKTVGPLSSSTTYYWRVRAKIQGKYTPFSSSRSFSTSSSTVGPQPPTLASPADSATNVSINPTLSWNALPGATQYHLQVSLAPTFTSNIVDDSTLTVTSKTVGPLSSLATYYWRVRVKIQGQYTPFSTPRVFSTSSSISGPAPGPTLAAPADSARNVSLNPTLSWNALTGATSYQLQLAGDPSFNANIVDDSSITATSKTVGPLSSGALYCWRVRAKVQGAYTQFSQPRSFSTALVAGQPPTLSAPADSTRNVSLTPTLRWDVLPGATSYHLQLSADSSFRSNVVNDSSITETSKTVGPLLPGTIYCWRVRAKMQGVYTPFSLPRSFSTIPLVGQPPTLAAPVDSARNVSITPTLSWDALPGATSYHLQLSIGPQFVTNIVNDSSLTVTSKAVGPLSLVTTYYWRVRGNVQGIYSPFSPIWQFTTVRTTSIERQSADIPRDFELGQNYPNPFNPTTTIQFAVPKASYVSLKIFDLLGKEVGTLVSQQLGPGYFSVKLQANLPSGTYIYRLRAGEFVDSKRMILLR